MNYFAGNEWSKNQYENLGAVHNRSTFRPVMSVVVIGLCMTFLILTAWNFNGIHTSLLRDMNNFPILNEQFVNLARHLAPAYVRVGGTSADCLYFNKTARVNSEKIISPVDGQDISNFAITYEDFKNIYNFVERSQLRLIFDLNVLMRNTDDTWNDSNARDIISSAGQCNMSLDWQLGNEPNSFHHVFNVTITATQLANDYYHLKRLLNDAGYSQSLIVGPEVNHIGDVNHQGELYAKTFLENDRDCVNYFTWHQYYLNGRTARVEDFINPTTFNYLPFQIKSVKETIKSCGKNILMWLSETSSAYGGGAPELSDRFVAGFLWLDKLGYSASTGVNVVTRQSLFGGHYAMVAPDLTPNPDWWVSVVYKQFVAEEVLKLTTVDNFGRVRLYAHCTPRAARLNRVPAITLYGVNINSISQIIYIQGLRPVLHRNAKIFFYALTADSLQSSDIKMNGKLLKLRYNGDLPPFQPAILHPLEPIKLPAYSMVFLVIHGAEIPACSM